MHRDYLISFHVFFYVCREDYMQGGPLKVSHI